MVMSIGKDAVDRMFAKQELFDKAYQEGTIIFYEHKDVMDDINKDDCSIILGDTFGQIENLISEDKELIEQTWNEVDVDDEQGRIYRDTTPDNEFYEVLMAWYGDMYGYVYIGTKIELADIMKEVKEADVCYFQPRMVRYRGKMLSMHGDKVIRDDEGFPIGRRS